MAEVMLYVDEFAGTAQAQTNPLRHIDGDIISAPNSRRTGYNHVEHICHPVYVFQRNADGPWTRTGPAPFTGDGLRPDGMARQFYERTRCRLPLPSGSPCRLRASAR